MPRSEQNYSAILFDKATTLDYPALVLRSREVHIWAVALNRPGPEIEELRKLLDPAERQRADRFRFEADRLRYVVAHGYVRRVLSTYTKTAPENLSMIIGKYGKPELEQGIGRPGLHYSLSHSKEYAAIAVAQSPLGVDVEDPRELVDMGSLALSTFHPGEASAILSRSGKDAEAAFFCCWTRKEAVVKALGSGLFMPLDCFEVSVDRCHPRLLSFHSDWFPDGELHLLHFELPGDTIGAAAMPFVPVTVKAVLIS